jgi:hypothetical protein
VATGKKNGSTKKQDMHQQKNMMAMKPMKMPEKSMHSGKDCKKGK